ncbi:hypothetical protein GGR51DRAFT_343553 [Nemania sp. FL0031]|nr:hypothetical protein GGR51DRAFT_343553 [Nemania sp. FL0031]
MAAITALSNLGALPTNFALGSSCTSKLNDVYKVFTESPGYYYLLQGPVEQTSCYPSGYNAASTQYYSPARCPTGFTSACQSTNIAGTVSETVVTCCPTQADYSCQTTLEYVWQSTLGCATDVDTATSTTWTVTQVTDGTTSVTTSPGFTGGMNAYGIKVGFQSTDFRSTTTTTTKKTTTKATTTARTTKATTTSTGTHSSSSSSKTKKKKTSGGVIAGIVIGVIAGVAAIAAVIFALVRKRNKDKEVAEVINTYEPKDKDVAPAPQIHEMGTQYERAVELEGSDARSGMTPHTQSQASPSPLSARTGTVY